MNAIGGAFVVAMAALVLHVNGGQASQNSSDELLRNVGGYVAKYEQSFSTIICQEQYSQRARNEQGWATKLLRSEVALVGAASGDWMFYRDVHTVDGMKVADRGERLARLFTASGEGAAPEAARILAESARHNIGNVHRTLNIPTLAVTFLRTENHAHFSFSIGRSRTVRGVAAVELRFHETGAERMITTRDNAPVEGQALVDTRTGAILITELIIASEGTTGRVAVTFDRLEAPAMLVPKEMSETYWTSNPSRDATGVAVFDRMPGEARTLVEGVATYSACRQFSVRSRIK